MPTPRNDAYDAANRAAALILRHSDGLAGDWARLWLARHPDCANPGNGGSSPRPAQAIPSR